MNGFQKVDTILELDGPGAELPEFVAAAEAVKSSRTVVLMLAFVGAAAEALEGVPFDAVLVEDETAASTISYLARESSKPGRESESESESESGSSSGAAVSTWVAHATPEFAAEVLGQGARGPPASDPTAADALAHAEACMTSSVAELLSSWLQDELPAPVHAKVRNKFIKCSFVNNNKMTKN